VLTIVDVYDALTTERPYKRALDVDQALDLMKKEVKKGWWDPRLFAAFQEMMQIGLPDILAVKAAAAD
jgi:putative two-component system response regulator